MNMQLFPNLTLDTSVTPMLFVFSSMTAMPNLKIQFWSIWSEGPPIWSSFSVCLSFRLCLCYIQNFDKFRPTIECYHVELASKRTGTESFSITSIFLSTQRPFVLISLLIWDFKLLTPILLLTAMSMVWRCLFQFSQTRSNFHCHSLCNYRPTWMHWTFYAIVELSTHTRTSLDWVLGSFYFKLKSFKPRRSSTYILKQCLTPSYFLSPTLLLYTRKPGEVFHNGQEYLIVASAFFLCMTLGYETWFVQCTTTI